MAVSDAAFSRWLARTNKRVLLAEMSYAAESGGNVAERTVYLSSQPYTTRPTDSPASQPYHAVIAAASMTRGLDVNSMGGRSTFSPSDLVLESSDGEVDFLRDLIIDGWEVNFYLGDPSWARSDFRLVAVAVAQGVYAQNDGQIAIRLTDRRLLLDREIKGDVLGGSGPNATKYLPLLWGYAENVDLTPWLYDSSAQEYGVLSNYGASTSGVADVRDNGASLRSAAQTWTSANTTVNTGTDVVTHVAHGLAVDDVVAFTDAIGTPVFLQTGLRRPFAHTGSGVQLWVKSVPTADTVTFSLTKGGATLDFTAASWNPDNGGADLYMIRQRFYDSTATNGRIKLSSKATGRVTADVLSFQKITGDEGDWFVDSTLPFDLAGGLAYGFGGLALADIDTDGITDADAALDAKVTTGLTSLWLPERRNLTQVIGEWLDAVFGWYGQDQLGRFTVGLVDPSGLEAATAAVEIARNDLLGDPRVENLAPTFSRVNVGYEVNHTVQPVEGLLESIDDDLKTKYGQPYAKIQRSTAPSGTAYSTNKPAYHLTMTEAAPRAVNMHTTWPALIGGPYPVDGYADEIVADRRPNLRTCIASWAWSSTRRRSAAWRRSPTRAMASPQAATAA